jgi:hypothetical protein
MSQARGRAKFVIADWARFFKPIKLIDFICDAEAENAPQLFTESGACSASMVRRDIP